MRLCRASVLLLVKKKKWTHLWVLSKSHAEGWFLGWSWIQNTKSGEFLDYSCFLGSTGLRGSSTLSMSIRSLPRWVTETSGVVPTASEVSPRSTWWWTSGICAQKMYTHGIRATDDLGCLEHRRRSEVHIQVCPAHLLSLISFHCHGKIFPTNLFSSHFVTNHILTVSRIKNIFLLIRNNSSLLY